MPGDFDDVRSAIGDNALVDHDVASLTTYRVGGRAAVFVRIDHESELERVAEAARVHSLPILVIFWNRPAMLAGLPQNPYRANPINNFKAAKRRQLVVIGRMQDVGLLTAEQAQAARDKVLDRLVSQGTWSAALVQDAKMKCPISKALNPSIEITVSTSVK